ncbi:hypothetical protein SAMN05216466_112202 [Paraburkholderia phenazinium]|jgi:hypothetical protein|uniref:Uncharacterized protein n=1 Tax=Paraburkholderia phenazinium TaxID=60549 RepID=A0A1G8ERG5_9BURK|nr:hypothetical protein SAMN05216466_112202 [Paraburkholderia phenazinium]
MGGNWPIGYLLDGVKQGQYHHERIFGERWVWGGRGAGPWISYKFQERQCDRGSYNGRCCVGGRGSGLC